MYICVRRIGKNITLRDNLDKDVLFPIQELWEIKFGTFRYISFRESFAYINTIAVGLIPDANTIDLWATRRDERHPPLQEVCHYIQC